MRKNREIRKGECGLFAINLIVVSSDDGLYQRVLEELGEENIYPEIIRGSTLREAVSVLGMDHTHVLPMMPEGEETDGTNTDPGNGSTPESSVPGYALPDRTDPEEVLSYIRMYIRLHLAEPLDLTKVAHEIGLTSTYLCHLFKKHHGISMQKFIERNRIEKAAYLLETENATIGEISVRVGFRSNSYFSKIFREYYGMTPHKYRKHLKLKEIRKKNMTERHQ